MGFPQAAFEEGNHVPLTHGLRTASYAVALVTRFRKPMDAFWQRRPLRETQGCKPSRSHAAPDGA